jgi:hypothetical protein
MARMEMDFKSDSISCGATRLGSPDPSDVLATALCTPAPKRDVAADAVSGT